MVTVIPEETHIEGTIETAGDLRVEGRCNGRIDIGGQLVITAPATCTAHVRARSALISGHLIGSVMCAESVELLRGARVVGDVRAPEVSVDPGAEVDGRIDLLAPAPEAQQVFRVRMSQRKSSVRRPAVPPPSGEELGEFAGEPEFSEAEKSRATQHLHPGAGAVSRQLGYDLQKD